ncbi:MAG TPA: chromate transporter [Anaeromyxobacter sp.]|nr:chromate transporter [Anaeromyxobacter sp.]
MSETPAWTQQGVVKPRPLSSRRVRPTGSELLRASLWLGAVGFGGGLSVLGTMHDLLVVRRRWLTEREFATTATVSQMLPGGAAANALAYTGLRFHGPLGAVAVYSAFIAPGALLVGILAALYVHLGVAPRFAPLLSGLNAAVVGIVASITLRMVRTGVARLWQMAVAAVALLFALGGGAAAGEVVALGIAVGLFVDLGTKRFRLARLRKHTARPAPPVASPEEGTPLPLPPARSDEDRPDPAPAFFLAPSTLASVGALASMAIALARAGLGAYGGGFAIIPNLQATVLAHGWLTPQQFADAVAIGKLTPGPVLLMATFIGYVLHGALGAVVATLAIFSGPLALVVAIGGWLARVRSRRPVRAALRGLTPAVVGLMAAAALTLGQSLEGPPELAIAAATLLTLTRFSINPVWVMALGGVARLLLRLAGV